MIRDKHRGDNFISVRLRGDRQKEGFIYDLLNDIQDDEGG